MTPNEYQENMTLNEYQQKAQSTAIFPRDEGLTYSALGLGNEAGEYQGVIKKIIRDGIKLDTKLKAARELGDVLWYVATCANELDMTLEDIAKINVDKLASRQQRGTLGGSGDNR